VFAGVVEVEDLLGIGEVDAGVLPNPRGPVSEIRSALRGGVAAAQRFGPQEGAQVAAVFKSADVGGGAGVAHGLALVVDGGLGEDTAEFDFVGAGRTVGLPAFDVGQLAAPERDAGAVAGKVKDGNGSAGGRRQCGLCGTQGGSEFSDKATEVAACEIESEVGVKVCLGIVVRAALGHGAADDAGETWRVSANQIQRLVQRVASGVRLGVIVIPAAQRNDAKEGIHLTQAGMIDDLQRPCRLIICDQRTVIEQVLDDAPGIPEHRIAQAHFETLDDARYAFLGERLVKGFDEGFRFAVSFLETFLAEFFLDAMSADTDAADGSARRVRLSSMASCARCAVSSSKR